MASAFASVFAQQFSSFCLKKNIRLVSALPDAVTQQQGKPVHSFVLDREQMPSCEDWIVRHQHYSIVFRYLAADHTDYWLHDIEQSEILHIRFIHHLCYAGVTFLELNALQQRAVFGKMFYHPDPVDQALILLLQYGFKQRNTRILQKYAALLQQAYNDHDTVISERMIELFGSEQALELERNIKRKGDASGAATLSPRVFLSRTWMRIGGDLYQDSVTYGLKKAETAWRNIRIKISLQGGSAQRQTDLTAFLQHEFQTLHPYITITDKTVSPFTARLMKWLVIPACLDRNSLQNAVASGFSRGLVLPHEISMERSQALLRNHIIARLDQYFSDNPF